MSVGQGSTVKEVVEETRKILSAVCSPAPSLHDEGELEFLNDIEGGLANNRVLSESTTVSTLYYRLWTLSHIEKGTSLDTVSVSPSYVDYSVFEAWRAKHPHVAMDYSDDGCRSIKMWTDTWYLSANVYENNTKVGLYYDHVKGTDPFKQLLDNLKKDPVGSYARWFYRDSNGAICDRAMKLGGNVPKPAFYPDIEDLHAFYDEYAESSANVLLLIGPPGTGKTTFLRGFLQHCNINAWVTYDPRIQQDEGFVVNFADPGDEDGRVLILEDCDTLMESRTDGNNLMNRILNLSDGIIQLPKRKLIFSTNLPSLASVDEALLRPGRCFCAVRFRNLTPVEATKAAHSVGLNRTFHAPVTLAEAINAGNGTDVVVKKIGF